MTTAIRKNSFFGGGKREKAFVGGLSSYFAERELGELPLEVIVASHSAVSGDDNQLLVLGPSQTLDGAFVPLSKKCRVLQ
jgi:hypothetical protein